MIDVGKCVRVAMASRDMTSVELAKRLQVSPTQVVRWRKADTLKLSAIELIANELDMPLTEFLNLK
jgi:transcriptional regulator with XRE-family HTH domain